MPDKKLTEGTTPIDYEGTLKSLTESYYNALDSINRLQADKQILEIELKAMRGAANSYKAEIERLKANNKTLENVVKNTFIKKAGFDIDPLVEIKAEAYKEFAERLKQLPYIPNRLNLHKAYDNLLKEMVGDNQ